MIKRVVLSTYYSQSVADVSVKVSDSFYAALKEHLPTTDVTVFCAVWSGDPDREGLLETHVRSVLRQTQKVFPLYVFDGADQPPSWFDLPHVICDSPLSIYQAWNIAVQLAPTDLVQNLNLDDRLFRNSVAVFSTVIQATQADLVGGEWLLSFDQGALGDKDTEDYVWSIYSLNKTEFSPEWPPSNTSALKRLGSGTGERGTFGPSTMWRKSTTGGSYPSRFVNSELIKSAGDAFFWKELQAASRTCIRLPFVVGRYHSAPESQAEFRANSDMDHYKSGLLWSVKT